MRILAPLNQRLDGGLPSPVLERALQAWMDFVISETEADRRLDDPMADELASLCRAAKDPTAARWALLACAAIFSDFVAVHPAAAERLVA